MDCVGDGAQLLGRPMQRAQLVAVRIAQIGQVQRAKSVVAPAGRVFAGSAAVLDAGCMKRIRLLRGLHFEADRTAVAMCGRLAVNGRRDAEVARGRAVEVAVFVGNPGAYAQSAQQGVVKRFGLFQIGDAEDDVAEHALDS